MKCLANAAVAWALVLLTGCESGTSPKAADPAGATATEPASDGVTDKPEPSKAGGTPSAIALRDVTAERVPEACRGVGTPVAGAGLLGPAFDMGGGVAVADLDGEDGPDVLSVLPGLSGVCMLSAAGDKPYKRLDPPEAGAPKTVLGFSVMDGARGAEPIVLGIGRTVRWARQAPGRFAPGEVRIFQAPGNPWATAALDLQAVGIEGSAVGLGSALPADTGGCDPCGVTLLPPGALALGPPLSKGEQRGATDPLWVGHPGAIIASAFAFGPVPAAFVTDLLGADRLYAFTEEMAIADRAWHSGVASGLLDVAFRSRGADLGDVDGDSRDELVVTTQRNGVRIYAAEGRGFFFDKSVRTGLFRLSAGKPWYGVLLEDLDGDGDRDLVAAGDEGLLVVENRKGGFRTRADAPQMPPARGLASGDLDGDGDVDLVVGLRGGGVRVLINDAPPSPWRRYLRPEWEGVPGRPALGSRVRIRWSDRLIQAGERRRVRSFLSASEPRLAFLRSGAVPAGSPKLSVQPPSGPELRQPWPEGASKTRGGALPVAKPAAIKL